MSRGGTPPPPLQSVSTENLSVNIEREQDRNVGREQRRERARSPGPSVTAASKRNSVAVDSRWCTLEWVPDDPGATTPPRPTSGADAPLPPPSPLLSPMPFRPLASRKTSSFRVGVPEGSDYSPSESSPSRPTSPESDSDPVYKIEVSLSGRKEFLWSLYTTNHVRRSVPRIRSTRRGAPC